MQLHWYAMFRALKMTQCSTEAQEFHTKMLHLSTCDLVLSFLDSIISLVCSIDIYVQYGFLPVLRP